MSHHLHSRNAARAFLFQRWLRLLSQQQMSDPTEGGRDQIGHSDQRVAVSPSSTTRPPFACLSPELAIVQTLLCAHRIPLPSITDALRSSLAPREPMVLEGPLLRHSNTARVSKNRSKTASCLRNDHQNPARDHCGQPALARPVPCGAVLLIVALAIGAARGAATARAAGARAAARARARACAAPTAPPRQHAPDVHAL
jgi:hypothetical protein